MALQPPFYDPPTVDYPTGQQHSQAWTEYHQSVADWISAESAFWASLAASPSYANDAAAAAGGVGIGARYRNGSVVMVRVS